MIEVVCKKCGYKTTRLENELHNNKCPICDGQLVISDPKKVAALIVNKQLKEDLDNAFKQLGLEGAIETIEKTPYLKVIYKDIINKIFKKEIIK